MAPRSGADGIPRRSPRGPGRPEWNRWRSPWPGPRGWRSAGPVRRTGRLSGDREGLPARPGRGRADPLPVRPRTPGRTHRPAHHRRLPRRPLDLEPPLRASGSRDFRRLTGLLRLPHDALGKWGYAKPVWHCSMRAAPEDRLLSDAEWAQHSRGCDAPHRAVPARGTKTTRCGGSRSATAPTTSTWWRCWLSQDRARPRIDERAVPGPGRVPGGGAALRAAAPCARPPTPTTAPPVPPYGRIPPPSPVGNQLRQAARLHVRVRLHHPGPVDGPGPAHRQAGRARRSRRRTPRIPAARRPGRRRAPRRPPPEHRHRGTRQARPRPPHNRHRNHHGPARPPLPDWPSSSFPSPPRPRQPAPGQPGPGPYDPPPPRRPPPPRPRGPTR